MTTPSSFALELATRRKQRGISQLEVAVQLGVTPTTVSRWENGHTLPHSHWLVRLASILDVDRRDLRRLYLEASR